MYFEYVLNIQQYVQLLEAIRVYSKTPYQTLLARPYDFMVRALAPVVERMGVRLMADCQHRGFFPTGGGEHMVRYQIFIALGSIGQVGDRMIL